MDRTSQRGGTIGKALEVKISPLIKNFEVSPDVNQVLSGVLMDTICESGVERVNASIHPKRITKVVLCVAYCGHGRRIGTGFDNECVRVWDAESGERIGEPLEGHEGVMAGVAVNTDGGRVGCGSSTRGTGGRRTQSEEVSLRSFSPNAY